MNKVDPKGTDTFLCTKPLHALGPVWGPRMYDPSWHNWPYHQFVRVTDSSGNITCGGLDGAGRGVHGPGKPSHDHWPIEREPSFRKNVSDNDCGEACMIGRIKDSNRPSYGIPFGTDCQEWADDALADCESQCPSVEPSR